jgi:rifampicin phosphotransferase
MLPDVISSPVTPGAVLIPPLSDGEARDRIGGKAANLATLLRLLAEADPAARVPAWFAIPGAVFERCHAAARRGGGGDDQVAARLRAMEMPPDLAVELESALHATGLGGRRLAVRSSAFEEDAAAASFAGQFDSVLGVRAEPGLDDLWDAIRTVWASALGARAAGYRQRAAAQAERGNGAAAPAVSMAVIVQEMVDASSAGVAFSVDPVGPRWDRAVVSAVWGLGEGLVSGELDADEFRVAFAGAETREVSAKLAAKAQAVRMADSGRTRLETLPDDLRQRPAITDDEAARIAACARRLAERLGSPQDIEWALAGEAGGPRKLYVLQTRPITTLTTVGPPERRVWDNSNIAESYGGVTTPLTFSFARAVYEDVYRQFCRLMGVSEPLIERHRDVFANMLGLVRGRIYYNLLHWYRVLALLPGFSFNRAFMERMMGVREKLADPPEPPRAASPAVDLVRLVRMVLRMLREHARLGREVPAFHARVDATLSGLEGADLSGRPPGELLALYRHLERELLHHWRAPLVNDFFAMIAFGVLGRLIERWLPDAAVTLGNDLLCGEGGMISTEPARRVMALAAGVRRDPALLEAFIGEADPGRLWARLGEDVRWRLLRAELEEYLQRFGDRCVEELKLETVTLREDPTFLIQTLRAYAARADLDPATAARHEREVRQAAEARVRSRLRGWKRALFMAVLAETRRRVRDRENLRFERTRVFGVVRKLFVALGGHLARAGRVAEARDVFYLTREEVFAAASGDGATDLRAAVAARRAEFEGYARGPAPPDRFESFAPTGSPPEPPDEPEVAAPAPSSADGALRGTGCCPGVVEGAVRIVSDPRAAGDLAGRILVAERTDPGWTLLFPTARGLLVQRGSLLSHSAIVARETGLPCIVGIAGLLATLREGERVRMDGATGVVERLEAPAA